MLAKGTALPLSAALRPDLGADAVISIEGNACYWPVAKGLKVRSGFFVSDYYCKGRNWPSHVQSVNRFDSTLKSWMTRFRGVATKYLANYLGWRRLLDRFKDHLAPRQLPFIRFGLRIIDPAL